MPADENTLPILRAVSTCMSEAWWYRKPSDRGWGNDCFFVISNLFPIIIGQLSEHSDFEYQY